MTSSASSSWAHNILNLLITVILESDLTFTALLGNVLFKLPFSNFPLYCTGFSVSTTNAFLRSLLLHQLCTVCMLHLTNLMFPLLWKVFPIQVSCLLSVLFDISLNEMYGYSRLYERLRLYENSL